MLTKIELFEGKIHEKNIFASEKDYEEQLIMCMHKITRENKPSLHGFVYN